MLPDDASMSARTATVIVMTSSQPCQLRSGREIRFYRSRRGSSPVEELLDSLSGKKTRKIIWVLRLIEEPDRVPRQYFRNWPGQKNCGRFVRITAARSCGVSVSVMEQT